MTERGSATMRVVGILLALVIASLAPFPGNVIADGNGNVSVTGTGTTFTGGTTFVNGAGSTQSNVGGAQTAGQGSTELRGSVCVTAPLAPASPGSASVGTVSGAAGGAASPGAATSGVVIGGNAIGGSATGGNATGGNVTGASVTGGSGAAGTAAPGRLQGGSAVGGSAVGGSAIGGNNSSCTTMSAPLGSTAPLNESGDKAVICGAVVSQVGAVLTISTLSGPVDLTIPVGANIVGALPTDGNVCLLLTSTGGHIVTIHVLQCHGSTNGTVELSQIVSNTNSILAGGAECGQHAVHINTQTIANGAPPSTVNVSIDCPDPCSPNDPHLSQQATSPLPTPTTPSAGSAGSPGITPAQPVGATATGSPVGIALQLSDLPAGFQQTESTSFDNAQIAQDRHTTLAAVQGSGHLAAFASAFHRSVKPGDLAIGDWIDVYRSGATAHLSFAATARTIPAAYRSRHARLLKPAGVGRESIEFTFATRANGTYTSTIGLLFRRGRYVATLTVTGRPSLVTSQRARELARVLDMRIRGSG